MTFQDRRAEPPRPQPTVFNKAMEADLARRAPKPVTNGSWLGRLVVVLLAIALYVVVRSVVYYYFMGHWEGGRASREFADFWFSWFIAVPITMAVVGLMVGFMAALFWIFTGEEPL